MNNKNQARATRAATVCNFLKDADNTSIYNTQNAFTSQVNIIITANDDIMKKAITADADNTGYSKIKKEKKQLMSDAAAQFGGDAYVHFENVHRHDLSTGILINAYEYMLLADAAATAAAEKTYGILHNNIALLAPDYVTAADCAVLLTLINDFVAAKGDSEKVHKTSPTDTIAFELSIDNFELELDKLTILARRFKTINAEFYNKFIAATKLPTVNIHHTGVQGIVTHAGTPAMNAVVTIENTGKKTTTDVAGKYSIKQIKAGTYTLKATLTTGETKTVVVTLVSGHILSVNVDV